MLLIEDFYPVSPRPRWGFGLPVHARIQAQLEKSRATYEASLDELSMHRDALYAIADVPTRGTLAPFWNNVWFSCLDAASLVGFLLSRRPKTYLEIGSGHSTLFARHAIDWRRLPTTIVSVCDPQPLARGHRCALHRDRPRPPGGHPARLSDRLEPGDLPLLRRHAPHFSDQLRRDDVFLDVLPRLRPGVLVHLHDIFLPSDYPPQWSGRYYSEQYLLAAMLLCGAPPFKVVLPNFFACDTEPRLASKVRGIFDAKPGGRSPSSTTSTPHPGGLVLDSKRSELSPRLRARAARFGSTRTP